MAKSNFVKVDALLNKLLKRAYAKKVGISKATIDTEISFLLETLIEGVNKGGSISIIYHESSEPVPKKFVSESAAKMTLVKRILSRFGVTTTSEEQVVPRKFQYITRTEDTILLPVISTGGLQLP